MLCNHDRIFLGTARDDQFHIAIDGVGISIASSIQSVDLIDDDLC